MQVISVEECEEGFPSSVEEHFTGRCDCFCITDFELLTRIK